MTDEELAKEFVKGEHYVCRWDMEQSDLEEIATEAFIAGLKAGSQLDMVWHDYDAGEDSYEDSHEGRWVKRETGRPKWHKVADGDLPSEKKEYWCKVFFYESEETFNAFLWFDPVTKNFKFLEEIEEHKESSFKVKTWCDILSFENRE